MVFLSTSYDLLVETEKCINEQGPEIVEKGNSNNNENRYLIWLDEMKKAHKVLSDKVKPFLHSSQPTLSNNSSSIFNSMKVRSIEEL